LNKALHCRPKFEYGHEIGCVLYLPFRHLDGDSFMDRSVYGHLCVNHGSKWQLDGRYFDSVDDYVECGHDASLVNIPNAITFEVWLNMPTIPPRYSMWFGSSAAVYADVNASKLPHFSLRINNVQQHISGGYVLSANTWYHLIYAWDGAADGKMRIYVNADLKGISTAYPGTLTMGAGNKYIGRYIDEGYEFGGLIPEARIYNQGNKQSF